MGQFTANISRNMHDFRNRYLSWIYQQGVPVIDADLNDGVDSLFDWMRMLTLGFAGDGSPNQGFKVVGTGATNDFTIKGGSGTFETAGIMYVKGFPTFLVSDITYKGTPAAGLAGEDQRSIFPRVTAVSYDAVTNQTTITDSAANYVANEFVGRNITPDVEQPANSYSIVSNTPTTIVVSGDITANVTVGKRYRIELSTPTANRTDGVYLNVYIDEVDSTEDPNLLHSFTVPSPTTIEAARRKRIEATIFVREDVPTNGELTSYTDSDGNQHFVAKIATIQRTGGDATIQASMVTDLRKTILTGGATMPVGTITAFGGATPPTGWLLCDGSTKLIADFPDLFSVLGTAYGGDGITTFGLPNLKGKVPVGVDSADIDFDQVGKAGGSKTVSHTHGVSGTTSTDGAHNHGGLTGYEQYDPATVAGLNVSGTWQNHQHPISTDGSHSHTFTTTSDPTNVSTLQPYLSVNYIIKF